MMENKTFKFKTSINCDGCVAKVTPSLNAQTNISKWNVDTTDPDKILSVESAGVTADEIMQLVKKLGFDIRQLDH